MKEFTAEIKRRALMLGFSACGVARAERLDDEAGRLDRWLDEGRHGEMNYMERRRYLRVDPSALAEGAKSVIVVACNYYSDKRQAADAPVVSKYAYGNDYHQVIKAKLNRLLAFIRGERSEAGGRAFVDSAPVLEKAWAQRSGIGRLGKNGNVIIDGQGSFHFLAELIVTIELEYDAPAASNCGACTRCMSACPTGAITEPYVVDARKCLAYLTVEYRGELPEELRRSFAGRMFGCDICQDVCPHNIRFARANREPEFAPSPELLNKTKDEWNALDEEEFDRMFAKSAVMRAGYDGLKRTLRFLSGEEGGDSERKTILNK
ncbi:MAG: tRNA epoxyqueuosine(34) reductase QueG [Prevotellaceae bacterium]|nr:tRNA epoxyqueuosine(34) reductase QueG [Prevotellaceae bacterium]